MSLLTKYVKEDEGATAVEYGILVAAIAAVIIGVVIAVGGKVDSAFTTVDTNMNQLGGGS